VQRSRTERVFTRDGLSLYLQVVGLGPQTVVIPNGMYFRDDFDRLSDGRTLAFFDLRNRGLSETVSDPLKLKRGVFNDVDDLEAIRGHLGISKIAVIGHSYVGLVAVLYAMRHPAHVTRVVQISSSPPFAGKKYPAHLTTDDGVVEEALGKLAELQKDRSSQSAVEFCKKMWSVLRTIYVANPVDAVKIDWGRCDLANERGGMKYFNEFIVPSMQALELAPQDFAKVVAPVLILHGKRDRSAPHGGAREWSLLLPDARLVSLEHVAHAPWIEAPAKVFGDIQTFLDGSWPHDAEKVKCLEPG
jgi:proline iminopeptidase